MELGIGKNVSTYLWFSLHLGPFYYLWSFQHFVSRFLHTMAASGVCCVRGGRVEGGGE